MTATANTVISQRFRLLGMSGSGGMATVWRALDLHSGQPVALKFLHTKDPTQQAHQRFQREVQILAGLRHPRIVSYIAHGQTDDGVPYLVMEWLAGEDVGQRLQRRGLTLDESLLLLRHAAEGLCVAHGHGILHRDIKPSNLFLRNGQIELVTLLDFGVARRKLDVPISFGTQAGLVVGTPEYMAPEQARGQRELSPSADIFALGCVLYECLAGQPPFVADHIVGVLAKILFDEPAPLRRLRPEIPDSVEQLVSRLLAKDPEQRPQNACELHELLRNFSPLPALAPPVRVARFTPPSLSDDELQLVTVIVATEEEKLGDAKTLTPWESQQQQDVLEKLRRNPVVRGAEIERLANGSIVATVLPAGGRVATDQAAQAARIALALRQSMSGTIVLCTGRGALRERLPIGDAIDRAVELLARQAKQVRSNSAHEDVIIDEVTAALISRSFEVQRLDGGDHVLRGERTQVDDLRLLLGKPTSCVGREQELGILQGIFNACVEESQSRAVLIIAQAGMGKSRLRHEFLRRISAGPIATLVLLGHGQVMSAGAPYGLFRQAIRGLCGVLDSEPLPEQRRKLQERVGMHLNASERLPVSEFLGELCGIPFPDADRPELRKARQSPVLMNEEIGQVLVNFLSAECAVQPVLLVLEDIHWADSLSIKMVERTLREIEDQPLLVLAFARPEVKELLPNLGARRRLQELPLRGLNTRACERLALEILGRDADPEAVTRAVQQAAGNALFLEELIRAIADGKGDELPETVLAMLQSRIARLGQKTRRVLRAGSIFGQRLTRGGVAAVLGWNPKSSELDGGLSELIEAEVLERHHERRSSDEEEYVFRHALYCDAAYGLLTAEDKRSGHQRAARYLEESGKAEPMVLIEHYRSAGELEQAVPWYLRVAAEAVRIGGLTEARRHYADAYAALKSLEAKPQHQRLLVEVLQQQVQLGMMVDPPDQNLQRMIEARELLGALASDGHELPEDSQLIARIDLLCDQIFLYLGRAVESLEYSQSVLPAATALGDQKLLAMASQALGAVLLAQGQAGQCRPLLARGVALSEWLDSEYEQLSVLSNYATSLVMAGRYQEGMALHQQALERGLASKYPSGLAVALGMRAFSERLCGDFPSLCESAAFAVEYAQKSGERLLLYMMLSLSGWGYGLLGNQEEALARRASAQQQAVGLAGSVLYSDWFGAADAEIALHAGDASQALALASNIAAACQKENRLLALGLAEQVIGLALSRLHPAQSEESDSHLAAGLKIMEDSEQRASAALLRLEWAAACRRRNAIEQASELRAQAVAQMESFGCAHLIQVIEKPQSAD